MTTNATNSTTITADLPDFASDTIKFVLLSSIAISGTEVFPGKVYTMTLDVNGVGSTDIPTPDEDGTLAWLWDIELPDGRNQRVSIAWSAISQDIATILAAAVSTTTPNDIAPLLAAKQDKDTDAVTGNAAMMDAEGSAVDTGTAFSALETAIGSQAKANAAQAAAIVSAKAQDVIVSRMVGARDSLLRNLEPAIDRTLSHTTIEYSSATVYYVWNRINGIHWLRTQMDYLASSGSWVTGEMRIYQVLDAVYNDDNAAITYGGTGVWLTQSGATAVGAVGATRHYAYADDHYCTFSISGVSTIWIAYQLNPLGGYVKPLIDGTQVLTKQHMPSLVGADYVWSTWATGGGPGTVQKIADNLDPQKTYVVRLETLPVATIPPGSTDNRFYFEAVIRDPRRYDVAVLTTNTVKRLETPGDVDSGWALSYTPAGASLVELAGNRHLNEVVTSTTWTDETGTDIEPDATDIYRTARGLTITQVSTLRHSETGTTDHATVTRTITFSQTGIRYTLRFAWTSTATIHYAYYGMMPAVLYKLQIAGYPTQYTLTQNNNTRYGQKKSLAAAMWDTAHDYVFSYSFDDPALVNNLETSGFIEYLDAVTDGAGKLYPKLVNDNTAVANGDVWQASWTWRWYEIAGVENRI